MASDEPSHSFPRPRALIADDSRIVRATLCKHLSELFDFSEALDGEEAWEILLRDESVDLLITDLTMPRLDGYGLLRRMRASRSQHLREMPVVVVSGTDDADERRDAREAGATDLITKGMATPQLVSRMTLLRQLIGAQHMQSGRLLAAPALFPYAFQSGAEQLLAQAMRRQQNLALLSLAVGVDAAVPDALLAALTQTIRQTDLLACTGQGEFSVATAGLDVPAAHRFADRLCDAARAALAAERGATAAVGVCCGVATVSEIAVDPAAAPSLHGLWEAARRRGQAGIRRGCAGAIGAPEESAFAGE